MKFLPHVVALLAFVAAPAMGASQATVSACDKKGPAVVAAISRFCTSLGNHHMVQSHKGGKPFTSKYEGKKVVMWMYGPCSPPQWVPKQWCMSQFYEICARGGPKGEGGAQYGRGGCQKWYIDVQY